MFETFYPSQSERPQLPEVFSPARGIITAVVVGAGVWLVGFLIGAYLIG